MLSNLDWLEEGQIFPPEEERERLARYWQNKLIYQGEHAQVYAEQLRRIEKVVGNVSEIISYPIVLNFQKKVSLKTADFLFQEPPQIKCEDETKQKALKEIIERSDLMGIGFQGAIDCSRYGTAVYKVDVEDGRGRVSLSSPEYLFCVVDAEDRKRVTHYVIAYTYTEEKENKEKHYLTATVYDKTTYRKMTFEMASEMKYMALSIGKMISDTGKVQTGLSDFAVVPVHNMVTSDTVYGADDYADLDSIVAELEVRTAQISKILDVFAAPTLSGSAQALEADGVGGYSFNTGNFYARSDSDEAPLEYITWNANLDSNFLQIERLLNHLSVISEMGPAIFNADLTRGGQVVSGAALRKLYINVLSKVARLRNAFDTCFKRVLATASEVSFPKIEPSEISITWMDGLPNDPMEEAQIMNARTGGMPTMSVRRALRDYDGLSDSLAEKEIEKISEERGVYKK